MSARAAHGAVGRAAISSFMASPVRITDRVVRKRDSKCAALRLFAGVLLLVVVIPCDGDVHARERIGKELSVAGRNEIVANYFESVSPVADVLTSAHDRLQRARWACVERERPMGAR